MAVSTIEEDKLPTHNLEGNIQTEQDNIAAQDTAVLKTSQMIKNEHVNSNFREQNTEKEGLSRQVIYENLVSKETRTTTIGGNTLTSDGTEIKQKHDNAKESHTTQIPSPSKSDRVTAIRLNSDQYHSTSPAKSSPLSQKANDSPESVKRWDPLSQTKFAASESSSLDSSSDDSNSDSSNEEESDVEEKEGEKIVEKGELGRVGDTGRSNMGNNTQGNSERGQTGLAHARPVVNGKEVEKNNMNVTSASSVSSINYFNDVTASVRNMEDRRTDQEMIGVELGPVPLGANGNVPSISVRPSVMSNMNLLRVTEDNDATDKVSRSTPGKVDYNISSNDELPEPRIDTNATTSSSRVMVQLSLTPEGSRPHQEDTSTSKFERWSHCNLYTEGNNRSGDRLSTLSGDLARKNSNGAQPPNQTLPSTSDKIIKRGIPPKPERTVSATLAHDKSDIIISPSPSVPGTSPSSPLVSSPLAQTLRPTPSKAAAAAATATVNTSLYQPTPWSTEPSPVASSKGEGKTRRYLTLRRLPASGEPPSYPTRGPRPTTIIIPRYEAEDTETGQRVSCVYTLAAHTDVLRAEVARLTLSHKAYSTTEETLPHMAMGKDHSMMIDEMPLPPSDPPSNQVKEEERMADIAPLMTAHGESPATFTAKDKQADNKSVMLVEFLGKDSATYQSQLLHEHRCCNLLYHAQLLTIYAPWTDPTGISYTVQEPMLGGNIATLRINNEGFKLIQSHLISLIHQIIRGIDYMHSLSIAHCNIRPEVIWLSKDYKTVKIG
eukprot:Ihof_evm2s178 gene=Ihof_evmTU2s178